MVVFDSLRMKQMAKDLPKMPKLARGTLLRPTNKRFKVEQSVNTAEKEASLSRDVKWHIRKNSFSRESTTRESQASPVKAKVACPAKPQFSLEGGLPASHMRKKVQFQNLLLNCSNSAQNKVFHRLGDHFRKIDRSSAPSSDMGQNQTAARQSLGTEKKYSAGLNQSNAFNITFSKTKKYHQGARTEASSRDSAYEFSINCFKNTKSKSVTIPTPINARNDHTASKQEIHEDNPFRRNHQINPIGPKARSSKQKKKPIFPIMQDLGLFSTDLDRKPQKPLRPIQSDFDVQNKKMYYKGKYYYSKMTDDHSRDSNDETQRLNQSLDNIFKTGNLNMKPKSRHDSPSHDSVDVFEQTVTPEHNTHFKITSLVKQFGMGASLVNSSSVNYYSERCQIQGSERCQIQGSGLISDNVSCSHKLTDTGLTWAPKK